MRLYFAIALALVVLGACTAPAAAPSGSASPTASTLASEASTRTPAPTAEPTAAPLIEVVGQFRTTWESGLRAWVPTYLEGLDKVRVDLNESSNRAIFDSLHAPGPYAELIR